MSNPIKISVPEVVSRGTKALAATLTTATGVLGLVATRIVDGDLTWEDGGIIIGAVATALTTIGAVWRVPNEVVEVKFADSDDDLDRR